MAHTFKATAGVYLSPYSILDADSSQTAKDIRSMTIWQHEDIPSGYTLVGTAEMTITVASKDQIMQGKVESLRAQLEQDRADSQQRQNSLIRKISELEALTYSEAA